MEAIRVMPCVAFASVRTNQNPATPASSRTPKLLSAMQMAVYWPTVKTTSISCWVS